MGRRELDFRRELVTSAGSNLCKSDLGIHSHVGSLACVSCAHMTLRRQHERVLLIVKTDWALGKVGETNAPIFLEIQLKVCPAGEKPAVTICVGQRAWPPGPERLGEGTANFIRRCCLLKARPSLKISS